MKKLKGWEKRILERRLSTKELKKWHVPNPSRNKLNGLYYIKDSILQFDDPESNVSWSAYTMPINSERLCTIKHEEDWEGRFNIYDYKTGKDLGNFGVNSDGVYIKSLIVPYSKLNPKKYFKPNFFEKIFNKKYIEPDFNYLLK